MTHIDPALVTCGHLQDIEPPYFAWDRNMGECLILRDTDGNKVMVLPVSEGNRWRSYPVGKDDVEPALMVSTFRVEVDFSSAFQDDGSTLGVLVESQGMLCVASSSDRGGRALVPLANITLTEGYLHVKLGFRNWRVVAGLLEAPATLLDVRDGAVHSNKN
jgi:hypothetical protein